MANQCSACGIAIPEISSFCPGCGRPVGENRAVPQTRDARERMIAAFAYVTFVPALVFLLVPSVKRDFFTRFHALQSILFWAAGVALALLLRLFAVPLLLIPSGLLILALAGLVVGMGWTLLLLVLIIKALQGKTFQVPLLGAIAEKRA